ncbi:MAG: hypothetical protein V3U58_03880 [Thermodesulfobacteriota bacterium]
MKTWTTVDRSKWKQPELGEGEPDKAQWIDEATGLDCLIVRNGSGSLCGYVGVPESHRLFEVDYDDAKRKDDDYIECHGGLTFSDRCQQTDKPEERVCYVGEVANKTVWWFGFDCAHSGDICPLFDMYMLHEDFATYKTFKYVQKEVTSLAAELAA